MFEIKTKFNEYIFFRIDDHKAENERPNLMHEDQDRCVLSTGVSHPCVLKLRPINKLYIY